jgi:hypothetical protein
MECAGWEPLMTVSKEFIAGLNTAGSENSVIQEKKVYLNN